MKHVKEAVRWHEYGKRDKKSHVHICEAAVSLLFRTRLCRMRENLLRKQKNEQYEKRRKGLYPFYVF